VSERVVIQLPLSVDAVAAIANGLTAVWPEAVAHPSDDRLLIIELVGPKVDPAEYDDWDRS
jgi:hypothetical protein